MTVEEAKGQVRQWLDREQAFLIFLGASVGAVLAVGWEAAPIWNIWLVVIFAIASFGCFGQRVRANQRLELALEERDEYREQRLKDLHAENVIELRDTIRELRQELATRSPRVH